MQRIVDEVPYVVGCRSHYLNPNCAERSVFRSAPKGIEFVYSVGGAAAKFYIDTTLDARDDPRAPAVLADLNLRLGAWKL